MAEVKPTTRTAELISAPFGMPRIEIPPDVTLDDFGHIAFVMDTAKGPVHVQAYWHEWGMPWDSCRAGHSWPNPSEMVPRLTWQQQIPPGGSFRLGWPETTGRALP